MKTETIAPVAPLATEATATVVKGKPVTTLEGIQLNAQNTDFIRIMCKETEAAKTRLGRTRFQGATIEVNVGAKQISGRVTKKLVNDATQEEKDDLALLSYVSKIGKLLQKRKLIAGQTLVDSAKLETMLLKA